MNGVTINPDMIRQLRKELDEIESEVQALQKRANAIRMMIEGAKVLVPSAFEGAEDSESDDGPETRFSITWHGSAGDYRVDTLPDAIMAVLKDEGSPIPKLELRNRIAREFPSFGLGPNGTYFYRTVRRLEKAKRLESTKSGRIRLPNK